MAAAARTCALAVAVVLWGAGSAAGQQFVTDDAAIVDANACQVEAWYARPGSWLLPACQLIPRVEITAGAGAIEADGAYQLRYVVQAKSILTELGPNGALGLVGGFGLDPLGQIVARRIDAVYAYMPVSVALGDSRLVLHQNAGWVYGPEPVEVAPDAPREVRRHAITWAMRADGALSSRVTLVGELFGQSRVTPEYQVGLRLSLVPDRLLTDVSYTAAARRDAGGGTFTVGMAWTPPPFTGARAWRPPSRRSFTCWR
jgi:hypothetical protein